MTAAHVEVHDIPALARALPPVPAVVFQLLKLLRDEGVSLEVLGHSLRDDPVLSGRVLQLANHVRRAHAQSDLSDPFAAASLIGINRVRRVVLTVAMNRVIGPGSDAISHHLFRHSLAVAITAQELALMVEVSPDEAYIAGILHDIGQLGFLVADSPGFERVCHLAAVDGRLQQHEAEHFGTDHAHLGGELARHWNLPEEVEAAIRTHHDTEGATGRLQAVISLAETLAHALDIPPSPSNRVTSVNADAMALLGVRWDDPGMIDCFGRCRVRFAHAMHRPDPG